MYGPIVIHGPETIPAYDGHDLVMLLADYYGEDSRELLDKYLKVSTLTLSVNPISNSFRTPT